AVTLRNVIFINRYEKEGVPKFWHTLFLLLSCYRYQFLSVSRYISIIADIFLLPPLCLNRTT
ncbi:hypothetical protein ACT4US_09225, partial [Bacillus sp. HC-Mk]